MIFAQLLIQATEYLQSSVVGRAHGHVITFHQINKNSSIGGVYVQMESCRICWTILRKHYKLFGYGHCVEKCCVLAFPKPGQLGTMKCSVITHDRCGIVTVTNEWQTCWNNQTHIQPLSATHLSDVLLFSSIRRKWLQPSSIYSMTASWRCENLQVKAT